MIYYIFRKNLNGFYDWLHSINKFKRDIKSYYITSSPSYKNYIKPRYLQAKIRYNEFLEFKNQLDLLELNYINAIIGRHNPKYGINTLRRIYDLWVNIVFRNQKFELKSISKKEIGIAILNARSLCCMSRKQVAEILEISEETYRSYEIGERKLPFEIYYKLKQFLEIEL